jgi:hypothetical protein
MIRIIILSICIVLYVGIQGLYIVKSIVDMMEENV